MAKFILGFALGVCMLLATRAEITFYMDASYSPTGLAQTLRARCILIDEGWNKVTEVALTDKFLGKRYRLRKGKTLDVPNATVKGNLNCNGNTSYAGCWPGVVSFLDIEWSSFPVEESDDETRRFICTVKGLKNNVKEKVTARKLYRVNEPLTSKVRESYSDEDLVQLGISWNFDTTGTISHLVARCGVSQDVDVEEIVIYKTDDESKEYARFSEAISSRASRKQILEADLSCPGGVEQGVCGPENYAVGQLTIVTPRLDDLGVSENSKAKIMQWSCRVKVAGQADAVGSKWFRVKSGIRDKKQG